MCVCVFRSYLLRQCNIHSALWKKLLPAAGRERICHWQNQTEVEQKMATKERKGCGKGNFCICSQAVDFTDYLNYNLLRSRGHVLFINIKLNWPNYKYEGYKKRKEDLEVFFSKLSSYFKLFQMCFGSDWGEWCLFSSTLTSITKKSS